MGDWLTIGMALGVILVSSYTCVGLLALWAATSPRHWLLRWMAVLAVLSPLLLVSAYEPWIVFALQICTVVVAVRSRPWWAGWRDRKDTPCEDGVVSKHRFRFSLGTLLAVTPLVAMLTAIVTRMAIDWPELNAEIWTTIVLNGISSGGAVLLGAWMYASRLRRLAWPLSLVLCLGLATVMAWYDWLYWSITVYEDWPPVPQTFKQSAFQYEFEWAWFVTLPAVMVGTWLLVCLWFAGTVRSTSSAHASGTASRNHKLRQTLGRCLFLVILLTAAIPPVHVIWQLLHPKPVPSLPAPEPNGLDDILAAAASFEKSRILTTFDKLDSTEELAAEIATYGYAFDRLRLGLTRETQVREWPPDDLLNLSTDSLQAARSAARSLSREAELAQKQERYGDAARIALDTIQLAHAMTRDGLLVDQLVGLMIEGFGHDSLCETLHQLDANECRNTITALVEIDRGRESSNDVLRRERIWAENAYGWFGHFRRSLDDIVLSEGSPWFAVLARKRVEAATQLLIAELALRAFQLQRGELPDRFAELTPEFVAELPFDPFDPEDQPLQYLRTDDGYVLYSIGADGDDDGGRPPAKDESGWWDPKGDGDWCLEVLFPPNDDPGEEDAESCE